MRIAVIGAGVVGLATTAALRTAGAEVRCFEAAGPMDGRSRGDSRVFRRAHADAGLVALAGRALAGWRAWERLSGESLVGREGTVVSGGRAEEWQAAMRAAGVEADLRTEPEPGLPARPGTPGPFVIDPAGGVIHAQATGRYLLGAVGQALTRAPVEALTVRAGTATVHTPAERWECDSVLVAAGAGTPDLVGPLGIGVPSELEHHFRFAFRLVAEPAGPMPCWLEGSGGWRPGFTSYGQAPRAGEWALGGSPPPADTHWDLGRAEARARSLAAVTGYVAEFLAGVDPTPVGEVYCTPTRGLGDGIGVARSGPVLAVWGENLFKFAPVLGADLATASTTLSVPGYP